MNWILHALLCEAAKKLARGLGKVLAFFWKVFIKWLANAVDAVERKIGVHILGSETFIRCVGEGFREVSVHYSQIEVGKYRRDITIRSEISSVNDIPDKFRQQAMRMNPGQEMNITDETTHQLQLIV